MGGRESRLIPIWGLVAIVLGTYGLILTIAGLVDPTPMLEAKAIEHINSRLIWGVVMLIASGLLTIATFVSIKAESQKTSGQNDN